MGGVNEYLNKNQVELQDTQLTPENLAGMIKLIEDGTMSSKIAKKSSQNLQKMVEMLNKLWKIKV